MSGKAGGLATPRLWGGAFDAEVDPVIDAYTRSLPFDHRLAAADLVGCLAHARMLFETGVVARDSAAAILSGLSSMLRRVEAGELEVGGVDEDVHTWIERQLTEEIGDAGRRLHTARSRNDQTAVAFRLWQRAEAERAVAAALELVEALLSQGRQHVDTALPGYTHMQRAQPTTLAQHLLAHAWSVLADAGRLRLAHRTAGLSPLGAGAMAGSPHRIDPVRSAELLGMDAAYPNSMWAVADRDYVAEALFACALAMVHLSRWAEEVVLWTSSEFSFARLQDRAAKGSSIMPQKKNPEPAEILRGKSGRVVGDLVSVLVTVKGLPLTYNSDMQEDKEALFDAFDTVTASFDVARVLGESLEFDREAMAAALEGSYITATDLADLLAAAGVPFRSAHERTGAVVRAAGERGVELWQLPASDLEELVPEIEDREGLLAALRPDASLAAHRSYGGPAPERVREQIEEIDERLAAERQWLEARKPPPIYRAHLDGRLLAEEIPGTGPADTPVLGDGDSPGPRRPKVGDA
ncbi:MAG: argininosuccinate lyase [Acidobacteria bacterium]|nr:argininosuccinate lyase [Acidobacteriota bacterium]